MFEERHTPSWGHSGWRSQSDKGRGAGQDRRCPKVLDPRNMHTKYGHSIDQDQVCTQTRQRLTTVYWPKTIHPQSFDLGDIKQVLNKQLHPGENTNPKLESRVQGKGQSYNFPWKCFAKRLIYKKWQSFLKKNERSCT